MERVAASRLPEIDWRPDVIIVVIEVGWIGYEAASGFLELSSVSEYHTVQFGSFIYRPETTATVLWHHYTFKGEKLKPGDFIEGDQDSFGASTPCTCSQHL